MKFVLLGLLGFVLGLGLNAEERTLGNVNDDKVNVRTIPLLTGPILGQLNSNSTVEVLGRSKDRFFLNGENSFWIEVKNGNIKGWVYGAFVNVSERRYSELPIHYDSSFTNAVDTNFFGLDQAAIQNKERDNLKNMSFASLQKNTAGATTEFLGRFKKNQSVRSFFFDILEVGVAETDRFFNLSADELCEFFQNNYDKSPKADSFVNGDVRYIIVYGPFSKAAFSGMEIKSLSIKVRTQQTTKYPGLSGRVLLDSIIVSPYQPSDFNNDIKAFYPFIAPSTSFAGSDFYKALLN